ncbi:MAG: METTL5 family protein [Halobacteriales archaeon]
MDKAAVERQLAELMTFDDPSASLEQYATSAELAARLLHLAALHGDLAGRTIVDLGTGTGILALGAALGDPTRVIGLDRDETALRLARDNEGRLDPPLTIDWLRGDATQAPLCLERPKTTVVMNPPFGAQTSNQHADRRFLATTAAIARVSYSIHNADSQRFIEAFAADHGAEVTHAFAATMPIDQQFAFHTQDRTQLDVEVYRIVWTDQDDSP